MTLKLLYVGHFDVPGLLQRCRDGVAPSNHVHALPDLERLGYEVRGLDLGPQRRSGSMKAQGRILRAAQDCDLIVAHAHHDVRWLALQRRLGLLRKPLCAFVHSHNVRPWHRLYLAGFDMLWPIGALAEQRLLDNGAARQKAVVFPYGADLNHYRQARPWSDVEPIVLSVGVSGRDFGTLIDAARQMHTQVHVVGRVKAEDLTRAPANVTFHSNGNYDLPFDALLSLYSRAGCVAVVHHGTDHPFGITAIAEALALGRPVVATYSRGVDLDVARHACGRTVAAHDPGALADAVSAMLADPEGARKLGQHGRVVCEQTFNCNKAAQVMHQSIARVLSLGPRALPA